MTYEESLLTAWNATMKAVLHYESFREVKPIIATVNIIGNLFVDGDIATISGNYADTASVISIFFRNHLHNNCNF